MYSDNEPSVLPRPSYGLDANLSTVCIQLIHHFDIILIFIVTVFTFTRCRWSNEGCESDAQCCSSSCERAHEGTNPRCTKSEIMEPCFFDYQCNDKLECGKSYHCCAPYWAVCTSTDDCCEHQHVCREVEGFIYSRCLFPSSASSRSVSGFVLISITTLPVFVQNFFGLV